jgi:hypothetical protein
MPIRSKRTPARRPPVRYLVIRRKPTVLAGLAAALVAAGLLTFTSVSSNAGEATASPRSAAAAGPLLLKPTVPTGVYLGLDPHIDPGAPDTGPATLTALAGVESAIGRITAVVSLYVGWTQPPPLAEMTSVSAQGSTPLVSWGCGLPDVFVANGNQDGVIEAAAEAYKAFDKPVLLRWFWEMNLTNRPGCGLGPNETAPELQAGEAEYRDAFVRIWEIFQHVGATNVAFVWSPSASQSADKNTADPGQDFYPCQPAGPGCKYVDWIGTDMYDRSTETFQDAYSPGYALYDVDNKPIMLTETGAPQTGAVVPQQDWLEEMAQSLPTEFPEVHGFVYVDATDIYNYSFTSAGLTEFKAVGRMSYFSVLESGIR